MLTILSNSMPGLADTAAQSDPFWRVRLTIVPQPREGEAMTPAPQAIWFRFEYLQTSLSLLMSTNCQTLGPCSEESVNALPATEPLCTHF